MMAAKTVENVNGWGFFSASHLFLFPQLFSSSSFPLFSIGWVWQNHDYNITVHFGEVLLHSSTYIYIIHILCVYTYTWAFATTAITKSGAWITVVPLLLSYKDGPPNPSDANTPNYITSRVTSSRATRKQGQRKAQREMWPFLQWSVGSVV